jgi:hypothetical protein
MAVWSRVRCAALDNPSDWLWQGDVLSDCDVPIFDVLLDVTDGLDEPHNIPLDTIDLIVLTQTCDLAARKASMVACCPIHKLVAYEEVNPHFAKRREWEKVRTGRLAGLHMIASADNPADNRDSFVVDFREIHSLPIEYVLEFVQSRGERLRLNSPYLEHFSQAFARFFMRVGLPSQIPPFK